jgi:glycolate oxidase subunit GlcD
VVKLAASNGTPIVPSGGRTGLSGGATSSNKEIVLSLERMNQIIDFDPVDRLVHCQAGVITEQLQAFAEEQSLYYPVDFASAGSSQIGGNIATNAGGIKVLKYGLTRDWVAGLTVVTANGEILNLNNGLVKNATGYDLRHLFIGSEGTLGIITEAQMKLTKPPINPTVILLALESISAIQPLLQMLQNRLDLLAFEFFSDMALNEVLSAQALKSPFQSSHAYYVLAEFDAVSEQAEENAFECLENCFEQGLALDGIISQSEQQSTELWRYREAISESISHYPPYKNDIAVRPSQVAHFLQDVEDFVSKNYPNFRIIWFGHIGDGNLHLNILKPQDMSLGEFKRHCERANPEIFAILSKYNGSISAEHGVGLLKKDYLSYSRSEVEIMLMKQLKKVFDPDNLLNPGKVL